MPPLVAGTAKLTVPVVAPVDPLVTLRGALGALGLMVMFCGTAAAATKSTLPAWFAVMVQVPAETKVTTPAAVVVHVAVDELKVSARPDDADAPVMVNGEALNGCAAMAPKVMVFAFLAMTRLKF